VFLRVESAARIPELVRRAFAIAINGRPGPVVMSVPEDVSHDTVEVDVSDLYAEPRAVTKSPLRSSPAPDVVSEAARILAGASRPVVLAGGGVHLANAYTPLRRFAEELDIPVAHTISGKGALACTDRLCVGLFGRYSRIANDLIEQADCLFAVGTRLGEIATRRFELIPKGARMIQLDCVPEEIGRTTRVDVGLAGDASLGLDAVLLASRAHASVDRSAYQAEILEREQSWRTQARGDLESDAVPISVARLMHELNETLGPRSTLVADGGFASHWSALLYETKVSGRGYIADRGFASIGYGLPGALGVRLAVADEHTVVGLTGDGGLNMVLGELETVARIGRPLTLIVVNNAASGYVKALQHGMYDGRYQSADLSEVDYARIAQELGWKGVTVDQPGGLREALNAAFATEQPTLVDVKVTRDPARMLPGVDSRIARARANEPSPSTAAPAGN
jgi:acetolactate synthase-1/2/3 large subunit